MHNRLQVTSWTGAKLPHSQMTQAAPSRTGGAAPVMRCQTLVKDPPPGKRSADVLRTAQLVGRGLQTRALGTAQGWWPNTKREAGGNATVNDPLLLTIHLVMILVCCLQQLAGRALQTR
jgi:hypothetical protein